MNINIDEFIKKSDLKHINICVSIDEKGTKKPHFPKNYLNFTSDECDEYNNRNKNKILLDGDILTHAIYLFNSKFIIIDIDDKDIKNLDDFLLKYFKNHDEIYYIFENAAWTLGNTKGIHIYFQCLNIDQLYQNKNKIDVFKNIKGDILNNIVFENYNKVLNNNITILNFDLIRPLLKDQKQKENIIINNDNNIIIPSKIIDNNINKDNIYNLDDDSDIYKLLKCLNKSRWEDYRSWLYMRNILYSIDEINGFYYFDLFSRVSPKYNKKLVLKLWNSATLKNKLYNIDSLKKLAKFDNGILYSTYINNNIDDNKPKENIYDIKHINQQYIYDKNDNLESNKYIDQFITDDNIKYLSIKSAYGTGKTTFIKDKIIPTYKRICILSFRQSLTSDLINNLNKDIEPENIYDVHGEIIEDEKFYNYFEDYRTSKNILGSNRIIISPESIDKLLYTEEETGNKVMEIYDIIILDEIESLLNQFSSEKTMKGKAQNKFNLFRSLINNSKKIIGLDGDLSDRGYSFLSCFGKGINIQNDYIKNKYHYNIINDSLEFENNIINDLKNNKKIVIPCMSAQYCEYLYEFINKNVENKNILKIVLKSDDELKKKTLKDINNYLILNKIDCFIFSPTISAGVDISNYEFDKQYGILSYNSCSARDFCQMMARSRKIKDKNIILYNLNIQYNGFTTKNLYSFDDIKDIILNYDDKVDIIEKKEGDKIYFVSCLNSYNRNYIYNKLEQLNNRTFFITVFKNLIESKGHDIKINKEVENNKRSKLTEQQKEIKKQVASNKKIIESNNINDDEAKTKDKKIFKCTATENDKYELEKYYIKKALNLHYIDEDILKIYSSSSIYKITCLLDNKYIKKSDGIEYQEKQERINIIKNSLSILGFDMLDMNKLILKSDLENNNNYNDSLLMSNFSESLILFPNIDKRVKIDSLRKYISCLNTILSNYHIRINYTKKTVNKITQSYYKLDYIDNIDILLLNKYYQTNNNKYDINNNIIFKNICNEYDNIFNDFIKDKKHIRHLNKLNNNIDKSDYIYKSVFEKIMPYNIFINLYNI